MESAAQSVQQENISMIRVRFKESSTVGDSGLTFRVSFDADGETISVTVNTGPRLAHPSRESVCKYPFTSYRLSSQGMM